MANRLKRSTESLPVTERHGATGNFLIRCDVPGWLKDALIDRAEQEGVPFKAVVTAALERAVA